MRKTQLGTLLLAMTFAGSIKGQSYVTAAGIRMGSVFGVSLQQKIMNKTTIQGLISSSAARSETTATILIQNHQPLISKRFNFFLGGGLHQKWTDSVEEQRSVRRGITAIAGAEMTLGRFNLSWDYQPLFHLDGEANAFQNGTAVSLRYVFIKKIDRKAKRGLFRASTNKQKLREKKRKQRDKKRRKRDRLRSK